MDQKNRLILSVLLILFIGTPSCIRKEPECDQERPHNEVNIAFYDIEEEEEELVERDIRFNRIEAENTTFEFIDDRDTLKSEYSFELDSRDTISSYIFVTALRTDTLQVVYNRQLEWLSEDCDPMHRFEDIGVHYHTFDSISIVQNLINVQVDENIRIFY